MSVRKKDRDRKGLCKGLTRREFIKKTGVAGAAIGATAVVPSLIRKSRAAKRDYILIGHPNPGRMGCSFSIPVVRGPGGSGFRPLQPSWFFVGNPLGPS